MTAEVAAETLKRISSQPKERIDELKAIMKKGD